MVRPGAQAVNASAPGAVPCNPLAGWAVLALGSNLGDRARHLERARRKLFAGGFRWILASPVEETEPLAGSAPGQGSYLNQLIAARLADISLSPRGLLSLAARAERDAGRQRSPEVRWGPRTLDVDIVLFGDLVLEEAGLSLPHPRFLERPFVVEPILRWWPDARHPGTGGLLSRAAPV